VLWLLGNFNNIFNLKITFASSTSRLHHGEPPSLAI
jgi:hypothetical protein